MASRRKTLKVISLGTAGMLASAWRGSRLLAQPQTTAGPFDTPLLIPPLETGAVTDGVRLFRLTTRHGTREFLPGRTTPTLGINGDYLGPTLLMQRNESVAFEINNQLREPTTLHWHGFHVPPAEDGGPHQQIESGGTWTPRFRVLQNPATFWYHSHLLHRSGPQVYMGLAGLIIVEDDDSRALGLPGEYGVDDIPLIVQDRRFSANGELSYLSLYDDTVKGMHGDTILVNGTLRPLLNPPARLVRFRLLNGANARTFTFAFSDRRQFHQIASDGGLLRAPVPMDSLELAPAERAEILVDFGDGSEVVLQSLAMQPSFPEFPGAMSRIMGSLNAQAFDLLRIVPRGQAAGPAALPDQLASVPRMSFDAEMAVRTFRLSMGFGTRSGNDRGPGLGFRNGRGGGHGGGQSHINGRVMDINYINERIPIGTTEIWELTNDSPMSHPFHVHHGQFQILDRDGNPPPANEMGWKDTVKVRSGERVRIMMRFEDFADSERPYMYHCHILEHEDQGMMGQFLVMPRD